MQDEKRTVSDAKTRHNGKSMRDITDNEQRQDERQMCRGEEAISQSCHWIQNK